MAQITPANSYPGLTKSGYGPGEPGIYRPTGKVNYFRTFGADDFQGASGAAWAKCLGFKKVYILDDRQLYGKGIADVFDKSAKKIGLNVAAHDGIESVNIDFRAVLTKVRASGADLIYFGGLMDSGGPQILQQMDALGMFKAGVKMLSDDRCIPKPFPKRSARHHQRQPVRDLRQPGSGSAADDVGKNFYKNYKAKVRNGPHRVVIYAYNSMLVILDSVNGLRQGSTRPLTSRPSAPQSSTRCAPPRIWTVFPARSPSTKTARSDDLPDVRLSVQRRPVRLQRNISGDMTCQ